MGCRVWLRAVGVVVVLGLMAGGGRRGREGDCGWCKISLLPVVLHIYSVNRGRCTLRLHHEAFHDTNITFILYT